MIYKDKNLVQLIINSLKNSLKLHPLLSEFTPEISH